MAATPIRTRGLTKEYGDLVAVDALDLEVRSGEIFGLLGQNGAGKTTTILMLLGLPEPTEGSARVVGLDPTRRPLEVKRRVGYLPDSVGFYGNMTGRENLRDTAPVNGLQRRDAEGRLGVVEILDLLRSLVRERGMAILLSSHLLNQVQSVCDRVGIFAAGRLIGQGTVDELARRFGEDTAHVEVGIQPAAEADA